MEGKPGKWVNPRGTASPGGLGFLQIRFYQAAKFAQAAAHAASKPADTKGPDIAKLIQALATRSP